MDRTVTSYHMHRSTKKFFFIAVIWVVLIVRIVILIVSLLTNFKPP